MVGSSKQNVAGVARRVSHGFTACDGFEACFLCLVCTSYLLVHKSSHPLSADKEWPCDAMKPCSNLFRIYPRTLRPRIVDSEAKQGSFPSIVHHSVAAVG